MENASEGSSGGGVQESVVYVKREEGDARNAKRVRRPSDTEHEAPVDDRSNKNPRIDSFEALDPEVRVKLRSMFDKGVIKEDELDNSVLIRLRDFPAEDAVECLEQFCKCDISKVRNKSAYIIGVIRRLRNKDQHPDNPYNTAGGAAGGGPNSTFLDKNVQVRLNMLFSDGVCKPSDIDDKCLEALGQLPPRGALEALGQFAGRDLSDVRSYSRFLMSIIRRVRKDCEMEGGGHGNPHNNMGFVDQRQVGMGMGMGMNMTQMGPMGPVMSPMNPGMTQMTANLGMVAPMAMNPGVGGMINPGPGGSGAYDPLQPSAMSQQIMGMPGQMGVMNGNSVGAAGGKTNYGMEQMRMGVRVDEFHRLSIHAPFVHYALALKLQELWDSGVKLVAQLDEKVWQQLTEMRTVDALVCIESVVNDIERIKNPNAYFMSMVRHFNSRSRTGAGAGPGGRRTVRALRNGPSPAGRINQVGDLASLAPEIRQKIEDIVRSRNSLVRRTDFDKGVCDELMDLADHKAVGVLEELQSQSLSNVKNMSAFIMSICRRYKRSR
ncbi:hypothetical protein BSKO_01941 [Bryopsis sp. KO-2023]|nr:hypothetical protein BSKO_01941 [Bryopsis sp. KO-2023]